MSSSRPDAALGPAALLDAAAPPAPGTAVAPPRPGAAGAGMASYLQGAPLALVLLLFLVLPLLVMAAVNLWDHT